MTRQVIALAGVGDLGRFVCEELLASPDFDVLILTRSTTQNKFFATIHNNRVRVHKTDYSLPSLLPILNTTRATTLLSFISDPTPTYLTTHTALLLACTHSTHCKRLIPSEYIGDSEAYPRKPSYYATSRLPFRLVLQGQTAVEYTLLNCGWVMDYFLPAGKTYMAPIKEKFPVDAEGWRACVRGSGEERQSWTCARDVGRAVVRLCGVERGGWEGVTYVVGEWGTFNKAVGEMEEFYGRPMPKTFKSWDSIQGALSKHAGETEVSEEGEMAQVEEMMVKGYLACPKEKTLRQREKYFKDMDFMGLRDLLACAESREHV